MTTIEVVLVGEPPESPPLRPIGTEFEIKYPPDLTTTNIEKSTKCKVVTYRVVAHPLVARFIGDTGNVRKEQLEVIALRYEEPEGARE